MDDEIPPRQINVQIAQLCNETQMSTGRIEQLVNAVCERFKLQKAVISIAIVDDEHIREVNRRFLNSSDVTDVLSFDLSDERDESEKCFEIVANAELAGRCAKKTAHSPQAELALYITHGLLHQLGFDDQKPHQAEKMHNTEQQILQELGYDFVYNQQ